eukprot:Colp12_sorted_trinity150504_noHs@22871
MWIMQADVVGWTWAMTVLYSFMVVPGFSSWAYSAGTWRENWFYGSLLALYMVGYIAMVPAIVVSYDLPIASAFIVLCEQVRILMKMHSYIRESYRAVSAVKENERWTFSQLFFAVPHFQHYIYFLFVPTLIFRQSYPRSSTIRWSYVMLYALESVGCVFYTYFVFERHCVPHYRNTGLQSGNLRTLIASWFCAMLPGTLVMMLGFFCVLHSFQNLFAELLRFADRQFYREWWNSTSFVAYYRQWNGIVHDWLHAYVYQEVLLAGWSRSAAMFTVFAVSAIVHEYIISFVVGFFYPVLLIMFGGVGVSFIYLPRTVQQSRFGNVFMWTMLMVGNGMLMVLYAHEYYARQNFPAAKQFSIATWGQEDYMELFVPRSWQVSWNLTLV